MTTYEQWKENDYLYPMIHIYVSDRLIKQIFDAGKKIGIDSEKSKHKWIPVPLDDEEYEKLDGKRVFIKSELGCTQIGKFKKEQSMTNFITRYHWYDDNDEVIDESFDEIVAYQLLPTD